MATNDFKPFATAGGANVLSQSDYLALAALSTGWSSGKASAKEVNKAIRQATFIAAAIAQFVSQKTEMDVLDDGDIQGFIEKLTKGFGYQYLTRENPFGDIKSDGDDAVRNALNNLGLISALSEKANLDSPSFTGTPSVPTAKQDEIDYRIANTAFVAQAIANLNGGAPSGLNTLKKLALAVNNDANFSTTVSNALGGKAAQSDFASSKTATAIVGNQPGGLRFMCGEASVPTDVNGNVFITLPDTFLNKLVYAEAHQSKNSYTADTDPFLFSSYPAAAGSTSIVGFAVRNSRTGMPLINSAINLTYFVRGY